MKRIGYIIRSYPRLSQTFIMHEILALEEIGVQLQLFPITDPREPIVQAQAADVRAPVEYLDHAPQRGRAAALADHLRTALAAPIRYVDTIYYVVRNTELDETTKTAAKVDALRRYFTKAAPADAAWAVYFLSGRKPKQVVPTKKRWSDYTQLELMNTPQEEFQALMGKDWTQVPKHVLVIAMQRQVASK